VIPSLAGVRRICERRKLTDAGQQNKKSDFKKEAFLKSKSQNHIDLRHPAASRPLRQAFNGAIHATSAAEPFARVARSWLL
jgi:hypothetical protein